MEIGKGGLTMTLHAEKVVPAPVSAGNGCMMLSTIPYERLQAQTSIPSVCESAVLFPDSVYAGSVRFFSGPCGYDLRARQHFYISPDLKIYNVVVVCFYDRRCVH